MCLEKALLRACRKQQELARSSDLSELLSSPEVSVRAALHGFVGYYGEPVVLVGLRRVPWPPRIHLHWPDMVCDCSESNGRLFF